MARSRVLSVLYFLGVVAMPFDAVPGLGALGELAHEGSFYFFFPALLYAAALVIGGMLQRSFAPAIGSRWVLWCAAALIGCVVLTGLVNIGDISAARFHDRGGLPKLVTSACVLVYGFALAWLTTVCVAGRWYERLIVPICVSAAICVVVCVFERAALSGLHLAPFDRFYALVHSGAEGPAVLWDGSLNLKQLEGWDKRLRSVSFEPPAFGNFTGLVWPWLACGALMTRGTRRTIHLLLLAAFSTVIVAAGARTGWLLLGADVAAALALLLVFLPRSGKPRALYVLGASLVGAGALLAGGIYYAASYDALMHAVVEGQSISDLSRLAYQVTAFKIFLANPLFGVGLGQFAFSAADFMPSWGFLSSEIRPSLLFPDAPWPNTYSLYARTGAEMGIVGLTAWLGIWTSAILGVRSAGLARARTEGQVPWACYAAVMSIAAILVSGFTTDTFRTPMIWITLGATAFLIERARTERGAVIARPRGIDRAAEPAG